MNNEEYKRLLINKSYRLSLEMIKFIDDAQQGFSSIIIFKQLVRSATSIGANIIEAQAGSSRRDFTNFLGHALKSANETRYWLGLLRDSGKVDKFQAEKLLNEAQELSKMLGSTVRALKGKK